MDRERFDALARLLATKGSRRGALRALLGAALLGQELGPDALAKPGKKKGKGGKSKRKVKRKGRGKVQATNADQEPMVAICHRTGNGGFQKITVAASAVQDHLDNHGDHFPAETDGCCNDAECPVGQVCRGAACMAPCDVCLEPGACDFTSLADAVAAATPEVPTTIRICPDTYHTVNVQFASNLDLTLIGVGAQAEDTVLDARGAGRVLFIFAGANVAVQNLTITGAVAAFDLGGGIYNEGTLRLSGVRVANNSAGVGGGILNFLDASTTLEDGSRVTDNTASASGGGIMNLGMLTLRGGSSVTGNTADDDGGGIYNQNQGTLALEAGSVAENTATRDGGGINNFGTLTLQDGGSVTRNTARSGGGIHNTRTLTLQHGSTVADNTATVLGGGIYNRNTATLEDGSIVRDNSAGSAGGIFNVISLTLQNGSSVTGNAAADRGGGILNHGTLTLQNGSSVTRNTAAGRGGGIFNSRDFFNIGTTTLEDGSSVTENRAGAAGGGVYLEVGTVNVDDVDIVVNNTLLDDTTPSNCAGNPVTPPGNCVG